MEEEVIQEQLIQQPTQQQQTECINTPNYTDTYGDTCAYYTVNYPSACNYFGSISADKNKQTSPNENCCVCIELLQQQLPPSIEPTLEPTRDEISSRPSLQPSSNDLSTTEEPSQQPIDQISIQPSLESSSDNLFQLLQPSLRPSQSAQPSSQPSFIQYTPSESPSIATSQPSEIEESYAPTTKASLLQPTSSPVVTTTSTYATTIGSTTTSTSTSTQTTDSTSSPKTIKPTYQPTHQNCTDTPNYTDIYNDTCAYYALPNNYPYACQYFGNINNSTNLSPNQNCCICSQIIPPFPQKWYPVNRNIDETMYSVPWQSDYISCIYGNDYPIEYYIQVKMRELVLFDTYDECCDKFARVEACRPTSSPSVLTDLLIKSGSGYLRGRRIWWTVPMFWLGVIIMLSNIDI